jgi:hypothetical protein
MGKLDHLDKLLHFPWGHFLTPVCVATSVTTLSYRHLPERLIAVLVWRRRRHPANPEGAAVPCDEEKFAVASDAYVLY